MIAELHELGAIQSQHEGEYLEIWNDSAAYRSGERPSLLIDFQGTVLAVCVLDDESEVDFRFEKLLRDWRTRYIISGS